MNEMPIKSLEFHKQMNYAYSMDATVVKIWDKNTVSLYILFLNIRIRTIVVYEMRHNHYAMLQGKQYTSIESSADFNDLCVIPNTGLNMMAVEDQKMQIYYIPSLGLYFLRSSTF